MKKALVSWSGGKDSCLACYKAMCEGYKVSYLVNTISEEFRRVRFHGIENTLIQNQAHAIGIPLLQRETTAEGYEQEFMETVRSVIPNGIEGVVFGDIHLQHCREWAEKICGELGLQAIEPLWGHRPKEILWDFIDSGFEALLVSARADLFDQEWLGRKIDKSFVQDLPELPGPTPVDLCGELGEYHTFVTDGPLFKKRINILETGRVLKNGYWFLDIVRYELAAKRRSGSFEERKV